MALVQRRNTRRSTILIVVLLFVIGAGGLTYWLLTRESVDDTISELRRKDLPIIMDFGTSVLQSERVQALQEFGDVPVQPEPYGRANPFEQQF